MAPPNTSSPQRLCVKSPHVLSFSSLPFVVPSFTQKNQAEKRSPFIEKLTLIGPSTHAVAWSCQEQAVPAYLPGLGGVRTARWVV